MQVLRSAIILRPFRSLRTGERTMALSIATSEIFRSIQGETSFAGLPAVFVRLFGCNLNCAWCDTRYAVTGAVEHLDVETVWHKVVSLGTQLVCITGGEPLLQEDAVSALAGRLIDAGHTVLLETNGTIDLSVVPPAVVRVVDVKCPSSGESGTMLATNLDLLTERDELKFVMADRADFEYAVHFVETHDLERRVSLLFSPVHDRLPGRRLAEWLLDAKLEARLQVQLHRLLWPDRDRGV